MEAYRNKMQMPVAWELKAISIRDSMRWDLMISQGANCPIQDEGNNIIAQACYQIAKEFDIEPV